MDIVKDFDKLKGWFDYQVTYDDGSDSEEQFKFKDFWEFRYYSSQSFLDKLMKENNCECIILEGMHIQSKDNKFHVAMADGVFQACCHNEIDDKLINKNYTKKIDTMKNDVKLAIGILNTVTDK